MTKTYEKALEESRKATSEFNVAREAYRAGKSTDAAFLAAKAKYDESCKVFDAAYAKEAYGEQS